MYSDAALSAPVTGFSYVYFVGNGNVYLLDNTTGQIGALQGSCNSGNIATIYNDGGVAWQISGVSPNLTFDGSAFPIGYQQSANGTFTPFTGIIQIGISGMGTSIEAVLTVNSVEIETVGGITTPTTVSFASYTFEAGDLIEIEIHSDL